MSDLIKTENKIDLSNDINVITAEINSFKQIAGHAIIEIGRRLKHVRDGLKYGQYDQWCEKDLGFTRRYANQFIQAYIEFGNGKSISRLGTAKLFQILQLSESVNKEEFIQQPHTIPSTGEQKTVNDMTVKELREVKKALKEAQDKTKQLEKDLQTERNKEPQIIEKISPELEEKLKLLEREKIELKNNLTKLETNNKQTTQEYKSLNTKYNEVINEKSELEKQLNSEEFELIKLAKEQEILEKENQISYLQAQLETKKYVEKITPLIVLQSQRISKAFTFKNDWLEMAEMLEDLGRLIREQIQCSRKTVNVEYSYNEEEDNNGKLATI